MLADSSGTRVQADLTTRVVISPGDASLDDMGERVEVDIGVRDVTDLYSAWLQVSFDPSVLQVQDADPRPSAPGVQIEPGDFLDPVNQFVVVNGADNTAGTIEFAVTQVHPAEGRSGSGVLATVVFEAVGQGNSPVHLADVELLDDTAGVPLEIPAATQSRRVTVGPQHTLYLPLILKGTGV